ncbi:MAG: sugar phosphate isomerase/epimerase [Planctomycetes bacterium]|nr:sugar phosphate isomerase/epimerase [Planctomycetota bacterium]
MTQTASAFRFGYNTNGYAHHRLEDALEILAEQGWNAIALTLDVHHLDPLRSSAREIGELRRRLDALGLEVAIETGARFVLDPRRKHRPTLLDARHAERERRLELLRRCADIGHALGATRLSFWAGTPEPGEERAACWQRLEDGVQALLRHLEGLPIRACLEPEPGMLVETLADFERLRSRCPELLLALDVGHLYVTGEEPPAPRIAAHAPHLGQVTLEDMQRGRHDHLPFGQGDVDVPAVLAALRACRWSEPIYVELGRHGFDAVATSRAALAYLRRASSSP